MKSESRRVAVVLGWCFLALGILFNKPVIEWALVHDSHMASRVYAAYIVAWQVLFLAMGLFLLLGLRGKAVPRFVVLMMSLLFSLFAAELMVRRFWYKNSVSGWRAAKLTHFEKNECGYRGQTIRYADDDFVIVLVGDSQVEARACAYDWMPERRLEECLRSRGHKVKVFTLGCGGYGQDQELLALQEYYRTYRADMVLLWVTPKNDIWNNMFPTHWPKNGPAKPTFYVENGTLYGPTSEIGPVPCTGSRIVDIIQRRLVHFDKDGEWDRLHLPDPYVPMTNYAGPVSTDWQKMWDENLGGCRFDNFENEKNHFAIFMTPRSQRMEYGLELTRALLTEISRLVRAHGGQFGLFMPVCPMDKQPAGEVVHRLNGKYFRTSQEQYDANVAFLAQGFQTFLTPVRVKEYEVGPEDEHLNEHAVDQVMNELARTLDDILPKRHRASSDANP